MRLLNHLNPADNLILGRIDENWPFHFLSEFSRFHLHFHREHIKIVFDPQLQAFMPVRFFNLKLFGLAQIIFAPVRQGVELDATEQLEFFNRFIDLLSKTSHCERLVQPQPMAVLAAHPPQSMYCEFGTYVVDLENQSEEQIFKNFHPKYQKAVNHSIKNNAEIRFGKDTLKDFYHVYLNTMQAANLYYDKLEYFETLYKYLGDDKVCCAVVYDQGIPVSGIFLPYTRYAAFLTHAGTFSESKLYGAAKLLNLETMKHLKQKGVKKYDFVGVRLNNSNPTLEGIFRFKKGFGGELKQGYLWKLDLLPMKAKAFDVLLKLKLGNKRHLDIIDQVNSEKQELEKY